MPIPSGWPAKKYITEVREAVKQFVMVERAGTIPSFTDATHITATNLTLNVDVDTLSNRRLRITGSNPTNANKGIYKVTGISAPNTLMLFAPGLPSSESPMEYELETAVARMARETYWFEPTDNLPLRPTVNELPMLVCHKGDSDDASSRFSQVNELDIDIRFEIAAPGPDQAEAEYFYCILRERLLRGRNERFGLASSVGFQSCYLTPPVWESMVRDGDGEEANAAQRAGLFWKVNFSLMCKISREINPAA